MVGAAVKWAARVLAAATALALVVAVFVHEQTGEWWLPYAAMVPVWIVVYVAMEAIFRRVNGGFVPAFGRLGVAVVGAGLAVLSIALGARYLMTPESLRVLDRCSVQGSVQSPRGRVLSYHSTNRPDLPRLILIHGTPGHAGVFVEYLVESVPGFEVVAVDRLGFGRSGAGYAEVSFEEQAGAIAALLEERGGEWPIVVGHSLGGPIAARVAADFPGRVRGLVILAGSLDPELEAPKWYNEVTMAPPVDLKMPSMYDVSNEEIKAAGLETRLLADVLDRIRCPVEVVHGTADTLVPVGNVEYIRRVLVNSPRIGVTLIEGEGHGVHKRVGEVRGAIDRVARRSSR